MLLNPLFSLPIRPTLCCLINQTRNIRPNIKIGKDRFQLQLDVRNYEKDEIRVKAKDEYVIIEGKQQKQTKRGLVMRQFIRKFKLPNGCVVQNMESKLTPDGILTITAPRKVFESNLPCEKLIPISPDIESKENDASFVPVQGNDQKAIDPCKKFCQNQDTKSKPDASKSPPSDPKPKK